MSNFISTQELAAKNYVEFEIPEQDILVNTLGVGTETQGDTTDRQKIVVGTQGDTVDEQGTFVNTQVAILELEQLIKNTKRKLNYPFLGK